MSFRVPQRSSVRIAFASRIDGGLDTSDRANQGETGSTPCSVLTPRGAAGTPPSRPVLPAGLVMLYDECVVFTLVQS
jgi:hypothetical protein